MEASDQVGMWITLILCVSLFIGLPILAWYQNRELKFPHGVRIKRTDGNLTVWYVTELGYLATAEKADLAFKAAKVAQKHLHWALLPTQRTVIVHVENKHDYLRQYPNSAAVLLNHKSKLPIVCVDEIFASLSDRTFGGLIIHELTHLAMWRRSEDLGGDHEDRSFFGKGSLEYDARDQLYSEVD